MQRTIEKERFKARSDAGGERTIIVYQEMISDVKGEFRGEQRLFIAGGPEVFNLDASTFQVYGSAEVLREIKS